MLTEQEYLTVCTRYAGKFNMKPFGRYEGEPATGIGLPSPQLIIRGVNSIRGTTPTHFSNFLYDFIHQDMATSLPEFRQVKTDMFKFDMTEEQFKSLLPSDFVNAFMPSNCEDHHEGVKAAFDKYTKLVRHLTGLFYTLSNIILKYIIGDITEYMDTFIREHPDETEFYEHIMEDIHIWGNYWCQTLSRFFPAPVVEASQEPAQYTFLLHDGKLHIDT